MDLIFWRHAQAEDAGEDSERKLTAKGRKDAARVAKWLRRHLPEECTIMASPARRAQETAAALSADFRTGNALGAGAAGSDLLAAARWPRSRRAVLLVGHQPALGRAIALALTGREADWEIRKGGIWWLRIAQGEERPRVVAVLGPGMC